MTGESVREETDNSTNEATNQSADEVSSPTEAADLEREFREAVQREFKDAIEAEVSARLHTMLNDKYSKIVDRIAEEAARPERVSSATLGELMAMLRYFSAEQWKQIEMLKEGAMGEGPFRSGGQGCKK